MTRLTHKVLCRHDISVQRIEMGIIRVTSFITIDYAKAKKNARELLLACVSTSYRPGEFSFVCA